MTKRAEKAADAAEDVMPDSGSDDLWVLNGKPDHEFTRARRYDPKLVIPVSKKSSQSESRKSTRSDSILQTLGKSIARELGRAGTRTVVRGVLGGLFRGR